MTARAYYNENDPRAAAWLRELIRHGHIAPGDVDERDIRDVSAADLRGYQQCHFFAGIGVWSYALRRAGWPDDRPVWTGSCPCQPFSGAGKRKGTADPRHLWPVWWSLIRECRPGVVLGEQVAGKAGYRWWDAVCADLESEDYAGAAADLAAASVGAPHIRQRLFWVANANGGNACAGREQRGGQHRQQPQDRGPGSVANAVRPGSPARQCEPLPGSGWGEERRAAQQCGGASARGLGEPSRQRHGAHDMEPFAGRGECAVGPTGEPCARGLGDTQDHDGRLPDGSNRGEMPQPVGASQAFRLGDANDSERAQGAAPRGGYLDQGNRPEHASGVVWPGPLAGQWADADWLGCTDGKWRPVEPGTFPLAHGIAGRVGLLRGYGNAICAPLATAFIEAVM